MIYDTKPDLIDAGHNITFNGIFQDQCCKNQDPTQPSFRFGSKLSLAANQSETFKCVKTYGATFD